MNENIQVACLPNAKWNQYPQPNVPAWSMGWGTTSEGGTTPNLLNNVKLTIYNSSYCSQVVAYDTKNWDTQLCAGDYVNGGKDTCQGDSGGALYVLDIVNNKIKYVCAGVVSYGEGCGEKQKPG